MHNYSTWRIEPTKILTRRELASVLEDLHARARRSQSARLNLVIFRLACCGLPAAPAHRTTNRLPEAKSARQAIEAAFLASPFLDRV